MLILVVVVAATIAIILRVIVGCCCLITLVVPVWQHQKDETHDFVEEAREPPTFFHGLGCGNSST